MKSIINFTQIPAMENLKIEGNLLKYLLAFQNEKSIEECYEGLKR